MVSTSCGATPPPRNHAGKAARLPGRPPLGRAGRTQQPEHEQNGMGPSQFSGRPDPGQQSEQRVGRQHPAVETFPPNSAPASTSGRFDNEEPPTSPRPAQQTWMVYHAGQTPASRATPGSVRDHQVRRPDTVRRAGSRLRPACCGRPATRSSSPGFRPAITPAANRAAPRRASRGSAATRALSGLSPVSRWKQRTHKRSLRGLWRTDGAAAFTPSTSWDQTPSTASLECRRRRPREYGAIPFRE